MNRSFACVCVCLRLDVVDFFFAVGFVSEILQLSVSYNADHDSHGLFRNRCIFACSGLQGMDFFLMLDSECALVFFWSLILFAYNGDRWYLCTNCSVLLKQT